VTPLVPFLAGLAALGAGLLVLRSFGPRYRVGRLLATTPRVTVAEALELGRRGRAPYVRVHGRIDSEAEFEGPAHEPLVLRLTRFQDARNGGWRTYELTREVVPFVVNEGLSSIAIDGDAVDTGLVVLPRVAAGAAADAGDRGPAGVAPGTPVRIVVEQVTSVEHAIVLGVPVADEGGRVRLSAGPDRPLVLTTLEPPEAMRVLAGGETRRPRIAAVLLIAGVALIVLAASWWLLLVLPGAVAAASPEPTRAPANDPRSSGEGPGLVGQPGLALLAVLAIAALSVALTLAYVRLSDPRRR